MFWHIGICFLNVIKGMGSDVPLSTENFINWKDVDHIFTVILLNMILKTDLLEVRISLFIYNMLLYETLLETLVMLTIDLINILSTIDLWNIHFKTSFSFLPPFLSN